jgi:hypothetical protein
MLHFAKGVPMLPNLKLHNKRLLHSLRSQVLGSNQCGCGLGIRQVQVQVIGQDRRQVSINSQN